MALTKVIGDGLGGTNDLTVDTTTLTVDATNNRVGVGTASPQYALQVNGGTDIMQLKGTGGNSFIRFTDDNASSDFSIGSDDGSSSGSGSFIIYDRSNSAYRLHLHSGGEFTMPHQPAFLVSPASSQSNIPINGPTTIAFGNETFDQNGDFSSNTFTAPVTGKYQLQYTATYNSLDPATAYVEHLLITSNRNYQIVLDPDGYDSSPVYHTFNICVLADMDASDTAYIRVQLPNSGSSQMDISTSSYFSGYLAC